MSTPQQQQHETEFRNKLLQITQHVKERAATARLVATIASVPGPRSRQSAMDIADMVANHPTNDDPTKPMWVAILINAEGRAIVSADTQILIYHLYRLKDSYSPPVYARQPNEEEQVSFENKWGDYCTELAAEIKRVEPLRTLEGQYDIETRAWEIVVEVLGESVSEMK